jgi:hypothetical protein
MADDDVVAGPCIDVRLLVGRLDDFAEAVGVKKPGGKVRAADLRGRAACRLPLPGYATWAVTGVARFTGRPAGRGGG